MAVDRIGRRSRIDRLWKARAEKQRRLGLGLGDLPPVSPHVTADGSAPCSTNKAGDGSLEESGEIEGPSKQDDGGGDGADCVGTLLVRLGQLVGVGGMGVFSLAPNAVATLMLEETSASVEEMDMEVNTSNVRLPQACRTAVPAIRLL